jgi:hypothetical protein
MTTEALDFRTLTEPQEVVDCYNEIVDVAADYGLKFAAADGFPSLEAGHAACQRVHDAVVAARAA